MRDTVSFLKKKLKESKNKKVPKAAGVGDRNHDTHRGTQ